jgi:aerobic carbon-monoxide dehydrogenase small subunit
MIVAAKALLEKNPRPTRGEIREAISGNLCRCTGYKKIVDAIEKTAPLLHSTRRKGKGHSSRGK